MKDKVLPKRLMSVSEDHPDDKELSDKLKAIKSVLKKRWNTIYNQGKSSVEKPTEPEKKVEAVVHKIPYLGDNKDSY